MLDAEALARWMPQPNWITICALSGGLDSMCLLHLLDSWCKIHGGTLAAAHFNHDLRPGAARDEEFVRRWCADHAIPCTTERGDVRACAREDGLSIEEAARKLRYAFLRREAERLQSDSHSDDVFIYTAHHMNDSVETVLLNLIRGTGIRGLAGIPHSRDGIVRPLLDVSRAELEEYAAAYRLPHVEDESNADPDAAARNLIRLKVLPLLREINPKAETHIHAAAERLRQIDQALEAEARARINRTEQTEVRDGRAALEVRDGQSVLEIRDGQAVFLIRALREAGEAVWPRMLLYALDQLGVGRKDYGTVHLTAIRNLWTAPKRGRERRVNLPERRINLPHGVTARCQGERLILEKRLAPPMEVVLLPGQSVHWGEYVITLREKSREKMDQGLLLRAGEEDRISVSLCPPGARLTLPDANGSRTVKRLCLDRRISLTERDALPAIYVNGKLAAVWRLGVDAAFVPNGNAAALIQIFPEEKEDSL